MIIAALAIVLVLLIAIAVAAALSGGGNDGGDNGSATTEASNSLVTMKVLEVRNTNDPNNAPMIIENPPDPGKHFVFVNVGMTNKDSTSEWFGPNMFRLIVAENSMEDGIALVPALDKTDYGTPEGVEVIPTAQPGETVEFWIPFEADDEMEFQKLLFLGDSGPLELIL